MTPDERLHELTETGRSICYTGRPIMTMIAEALRSVQSETAVCSFCGEHITLLGGSWTTDDGTTACTDTSAPYVPHKPKEG